MTDHPDDALAAAHVLGLLDAEDDERAVLLADRDTGFAAAVAAWRRRLADLDRTATPVVPDPALWARIAADLAAKGIRVAIPAASPRTPAAAPPPAAPAGSLAHLWESLGFWRPLGLAATAASLALTVAVALLLRDAGDRPVLVAVMVDDQLRPMAVVNAFADGRADLVPVRPIEVPDGRALQVWTLWDRERGPVSLGLLDALRPVALAPGSAPAPRQDQLFEITLEPAGGSPTGRPTGPILMKGLAGPAL